MVSGKVAYDGGLGVIGPWQPEHIGGKLVGMRDVKNGREGRHFPDLIWPHDLRDLHDSSPVALEVVRCDRAVARAQVDA